MKNATPNAVRLLFALCLCSTLPSAEAQLHYELRIGMNANFYTAFSSAQRFPGIRLFGGIIVSGQINKFMSTNYGGTIAVYNKSLGNNLNPLISDIQIDFVNSFSIGAGWKFAEKPFESPLSSYPKYLRTVNNSPYYSLSHHYQNALYLGTNFIVNNHRRNQTLGSVSITVGDLSLNYYNDGAAPVSWFSLGDGFDRYWTGGLLLAGHNNGGFNQWEFSFDQFTGYRPLLYELSNILGVNIGDYVDQPRNGKEITGQQQASSYNSSAYNLRVFVKPDYGFDFGVIGSLVSGVRKGDERNGREKYWSLQDIIHLGNKYALHANRDINRIYFGFTYNQMIDEN